MAGAFVSGLTILKSAAHRIEAADAYLAKRSGCFEYRCHRYDCTIEAMIGLGLNDRCTVIDVGSGWGELGHRLAAGASCDGDGRPADDDCSRCRGGLRSRYIPVDACIDGVDLQRWVPPRRADFFVALELLEHLPAPSILAARMCANADKGVLISTPNPETTDVLGMDETHLMPISREWLEERGFHVETASFYGKPADSLFGVWSPEFV
jgi:hypothetical protein